MSEHNSTVDTDAQRLALEIVATLINVKKISADMLLKRSGVHSDLIKKFLVEKNPTTGEKRSKREAASALFESLSESGDLTAVTRRLIAIAADWDSFHLAQDEYKARAVAQKARAMLGTLLENDERERAHHTAIEEAARKRRAKEKEQSLSRESGLLLQQFDALAGSPDPHQRGLLLEDLLNRLYVAHGMAVRKSFRRNGGGEQIDAAFEMDGWYYIVECRWREHTSDIRQLDGLLGQVQRSGQQTMGLFLSINGWSGHVPSLLQQNTNKRLFLMDGYDLRCILDRSVDLRALLKGKLSALNLDAKPFVSARDFVSY